MTIPRISNLTTNYICCSVSRLMKDNALYNYKCNPILSANHTQNVISGHNKRIKLHCKPCLHGEAMQYWPVYRIASGRISGRVLCSKHLFKLAICAKPNGRYIEVAVLQRAGMARRVYCIWLPGSSALLHCSDWRGSYS